jgi:anti-sigma B factor antagonist
MSDFTCIRIEPGRFVLTGEMTIYSARNLKRTLLDQLEHSDGLELDLAGVTEMDTSGAQVLLLLEREARLSQKKFKLHGHSQAVLRVIDALNLSATLGEPVSIIWN